jgi:hypothetical protein
MQRTQKAGLRVTALTVLAVGSASYGNAASAACVDPNTCYGTDALVGNTVGEENSAFGFQVLQRNTAGQKNTGIGANAMYMNKTGHGNTAVGERALYGNINANMNTAVGIAALYSNVSGQFNVAMGATALHDNTEGDYNVASGFMALFDNTTGRYNVATGMSALFRNTIGMYNTANGSNALSNNTRGWFNTAEGNSALYNAKGSRNVGIGNHAGYNITQGDDNIIIGANQKGRIEDRGVIRIGSKAYQETTYIAGIRGVTTGMANAVPVVIDSTGQLGTVVSSRRYKEDIQPMGSVSDRLLALRPVTFRYAQPFDDGSKPVQFGLVAEEVAAAFPELAVNGENGEPETVRYDLLAPLLLNELQKQHKIAASQDARIVALESQLATMLKRIEQLAD